MLIIEEVEQEDTFDVTNPENHNFFANDVLVHNSEIFLRSGQFCNLSEVVVREDDTAETLPRKVRIATILGTIQSTLTNFPYLRKIWKKNTEEERLLGVSLTGILDNKMLSDYKSKKLPALLEDLKKYAIDVNKEFAEKIGINPSVAITAVKPSGTVSSLVDSASGIHARHARYYYRRVRNSVADPITQFMKDAGIPWEPDVTNPTGTVVFTFPKKTPDSAILRDDLTAIEHLELWLIYQRHWTEHKPSITVSVKEHEWPSVGAWVWEHFDEMTGVSFLPYDGGTYRQAPYEEVTEQQYKELLAKMPKSLDWEKLVEEDDETEGAQTLACVAGGCEL